MQVVWSCLAATLFSLLCWAVRTFIHKSVPGNWVISSTRRWQDFSHEMCPDGRFSPTLWKWSQPWGSWGYHPYWTTEPSSWDGIADDHLVCAVHAPHRGCLFGTFCWHQKTPLPWEGETAMGQCAAYGWSWAVGDSAANKDHISPGLCFSKGDHNHVLCL